MLPNSEGSATATELRRSSHNIQLEVMRTWFYSTYEDPAESTPYESAEGGYIYIWGGPYDPEEELQDEFGGLIPDKVIEELATELRDICWEWTRHPEYDDIDDYFFDSIAQTTEHRESFNEAIANVERLLTSDTIGTRKKYLLRLLYVNVITILETYLSDLFISAVGNDRSLLRRLVETTPEFKSEKISVSEIFKVVEDIEKKARSYLTDIVWHHLSRVKPMFKNTLGIEFPSKMEILFKAVLVRHDLVHRNGKKKDGGEHDISPEIITKLIKEAGEFVSHVDKQWPERMKSNNCGAPD
jgi:hypothetical protein